MNCAQRILFNGSNHVRTAVLAASSVLPAPKSVRALPALRDGSARLELSGSYAGAEDSTFDIEILNTSASSVIASRPLQSGVGNGELSAISYTGAAQEFHVELVDEGVKQQSAALAFRNVKLVARQPGVSGNSIFLSVNDTLTYTALPFSLLAPLPDGTEKSTNEALDWNSAIMGEDGLIPTTAKRIVFGEDRTTVYRQWKRWTGETWEYGFEPALKRYVAKSERIYEVSGSYSVTVANGVISNTYANIVTAYDFLDRVNTQDPLIRVLGVIANDRAPGGQAAIDFDLRTKAYAKPTVSSGSFTAQQTQLQSVTVAANAATEEIEARCYAVTAADSPNASLGNELWKVTGAVSGDIGNFSTGDVIADPAGKWSFVIPAVYPDGYGRPRGTFTLTAINYQPRPANVEPPPICMPGLTLGPEAVDQTVTLVYTKRPTNACPCDDMLPPNFDGNLCLFGPNNPSTTGGVSVAYPGGIQSRMTALWDWYADLVQSYTTDHRLTEAVSGATMAERERVAAAFNCAKLMEKTAVAFATLANASVAEAQWDTAFTDLQSHFSGDVDSEVQATAAEAIPAGAFVKIFAGRIYKATGSGSLSGTQFVSDVDGFSNNAIASGTSVAASSLALPASGYIVKSGLTLDAIYVIDPASPGQLAVYTGTNAVGFSGRAVAGDLLEWANSLSTARQFDVYLDRYKARCDAILASVGISPLGKPDAGDVSDDGCWQDDEDEQFYWTVTGSVGGGYKHAFTNAPYVSVRDFGGVVKSSREFGFQINVNPACVGLLLEGDTIVLQVGDSGWAPTYQVGDRLALPIVAAANRFLLGGINGNTIQRWHVTGSLAGPLAPFTANAGSGTYSAAGLAFTMTGGGIAFERGDFFKFSFEGGGWQWRQGSGVWNGPVPIGTAPIALSNGLTAQFAAGVAPSFVGGDRYSFAARQPNAPSNVRKPNSNAWRWSGANAVLDLDFGAAKAFDSIAIVHQLPLSATVTVSAGTSVGVGDVLAATAIAVHEGTLAHLLETAVSARYFRLAISGASDASVPWLYVGEAFVPTRMARFVEQRQYVLDRAGGKNQAARYLGRGRGGSVEWDVGAMEESDYNAMIGIVDYVKENDDEPIVFFANSSRANEAVFGRIDTDAVSMPTQAQGQEMAGVDRYFGFTMPIYPVVR